MVRGGLTTAPTGKKSTEKYFLFKLETYNEFRSALEEIFSPSAASVILYESAKKCGRRLCERLMEKIRKQEEVLNQLSQLKREENWGKMSFRDVDLKKGYGRIWIDHSFEAATRSCAIFRGFLAGFLSKLLNKNITIIEEKHDKEKKHCEFKFASSFALYAEEARRMRDEMIREMALKQREG